MRHNILDTKYRKTLYKLEFIIDDKYLCYCYEIEDNCYCLRIYDTLKDDEELYASWFATDLVWTTDNDDYLKHDGIRNIVDEAYKIIDQYIGSSIIGE